MTKLDFMFFIMNSSNLIVLRQLWFNNFKKVPHCKTLRKQKQKQFPQNPKRIIDFPTGIHLSAFLPVTAGWGSSVGWRSQLSCRPVPDWTKHSSRVPSAGVGAWSRGCCSVLPQPPVTHTPRRQTHRAPSSKLCADWRVNHKTRALPILLPQQYMGSEERSCLVPTEASPTNSLSSLV